MPADSAPGPALREAYRPFPPGERAGLRGALLLRGFADVLMALIGLAREGRRASEPGAGLGGEPRVGGHGRKRSDRACDLPWNRVQRPRTGNSACSSSRKWESTSSWITVRQRTRSASTLGPPGPSEQSRLTAAASSASMCSASALATQLLEYRIHWFLL